MLSTGPFGRVVTLVRESDGHVRKQAVRGACEDRDFGVVTRRSSDVVTPQSWSKRVACMQREFWERATPDDDPWISVHGFVRVCGPGQHEASCVYSGLPAQVVEGVRDGKHLVRVFMLWKPRERHAKLARCFAEDAR